MFSQHGKREEKDAPKSGKARKMGAVVTPSLTYRDPVPGSFPVIISPHPHPPSHSCLGQHKRSCHQLDSLLLYTCVLSLSLRKQAQVLPTTKIIIITILLPQEGRKCSSVFVDTRPFSVGCPPPPFHTPRPNHHRLRIYETDATWPRRLRVNVLYSVSLIGIIYQRCFYNSF